MHKWEQGSILVYATSIASTWAWAPALFISGQQAYNNGLPGFLMFFIPNAITLFLFGLFAYYVRSKYPDGNSVTIENMLRFTGNQKKIHLAMTLLILFCSCCMQLLGIFMVIENFISSKIIAVTAVLLIALITTRNGIKSCIRTDLVKYFIIIIAGLYLLSQVNSSGLNLTGHTDKSISDIWFTFGIPTTLGLLAAPYIDSTFVQRMYCVPKEKLVKTFALAAFLFALIPNIYGLFGFLGIDGINKYFTDTNGIILLIAVLAALMSTLDSNLCALEAIISDYTEKHTKLWITAFYALVAWIMINPAIDMSRLFTLYCTIRCTMLIPTLLIVTDCYNEKRLFIVSLISSAVCCIGYFLTGNFTYTLIGLIAPILGYQSKTQTEKLNP